MSKKMDSSKRNRLSLNKSSSNMMPLLRSILECAAEPAAANVSSVAKEADRTRVPGPIYVSGLQHQMHDGVKHAVKHDVKHDVSRARIPPKTPPRNTGHSIIGYPPPLTGGKHCVERKTVASERGVSTDFVT
jgi:hypothetical protein